MILKFYVKYQTLYLLSRDPVVADSSGYLQANFQFTEDWDGTNKTAQFKRTESDLITDGKPLFFNEEIDNNGNCIIPWEVLKGEGTFNVNVFGQKTESDGTTVKTITVNSVDVPVGKSGLTKDMIPQDSTPSRYDNIYIEIKKAQAAVASDKSAAATSEANAKTSATNAKASETNAAGSAAAAANSAKGASTSATNAANSATSSANSATAAANSAKAASTSEANAKSSQTAAATSATNSANSASAAATSATAAKNSQTAAASSASAAASSASTAASSASTAATHETNAKTALASCQNIQSQVNSGLQALTSAVKYRGSVASYSALPKTGLSTGDMYNVRAAGGTDANGTAIKAGDNLVYNGSGWDDQSGTVDLSGYYTKTEMAGAVMSTTVSNDTITFIHKDATKTTAKVTNVAHATNATNDANGNPIAGTYLPLSGGTLTGDVFGVTPPNGDNSTKIATTAFVNAKAGNYLPLSGGTMTGDNAKITMSNGESYVRCWGNGLYLGGTDGNNNSSAAFFTNTNGIGFQLNAGNGTTFKRMEGKPDGTLTWDNKDVERVNSSGTNYIRYESGLQLCWGRVSINVNSTTNTTPFAYRGTVTVTFPVAFRDTPFGVSNVDDGSPWWTTTARSITSTTMQVEASGNAQATKVVCWFAVGRWK